MEEENENLGALESAEVRLLNAMSSMIYFIPLVMILEILVSIVLAESGESINVSVSLAKMFTGIIWLIIILRIIRAIENYDFTGQSKKK
ncbi:MAG: hypothetical protein ACW99A_08540 [Candidatus Kariarchaeaceae archaeon]|jgi:hypothetical protein